MYNYFRNSALIGLYVYGSHLVLDNWVNATISGLIISFATILTATLFGLSTHQNMYTQLRSKASKGLDAFDDDGEHLPSLYNFLKNKVSAKLEDKKLYLGDNRNMFERPYRFISDTKNIVKRVLDEIEWINKVPKEKFQNHNAWLFTNESSDKLKKERYEFYIQNMFPCTERDDLVKLYRELYPRSKIEIKTSAEVKQIAEREERLKNLPDHLNKDFFSEKELV